MTEHTRLDSLTLRNYRGFRELTIDFHPELTVLVARNGMGKTAALDACALAWRYFVDTMRGAASSPGFARGDIRMSRTSAGQMVAQLPVAIVARGRVQGATLAWSRELARREGRTTLAAAHGLARAAEVLLEQLRAHGDGMRAQAPELPVIAYYGTGRLWSDGRQSKGRRLTAQRLDVQVDAYQDCLEPRSSYQAFATWFERVCREGQRRAAGGGALDARPQAYIGAVRAASVRLLRPTGWGGIAWDFMGNRIVATHDDAGELPIEQLSDGVRNTLGLVADLAHRCVRLNPHHGAEAPQRTTGVVLIDEVDMHLHPGWQQEVPAALREAFPRVQFIVTTHSPQVLSTVPKECIRILEVDGDGGTCRTPAQQTAGVSAPDVLAVVMGVDPAPDIPIRQELNRFRALVQDGREAESEGEALRARLVAHFGQTHPEIVDLDRLLRFRRVLAQRSERGRE